MQENDTSPGRHHNQEIKDTPAVLKVTFSEAYHLDYHLKSVDHSENVVQYLKYINNVLIHTIPRKGQHDSVHTNAAKDEYLKGTMTCNVGKSVSHLIACLNDILDSFMLIALNEHLHPLVLEISHQSIVREFLFFDVEGIDDHTDEQVEHEKTAHNHKEGEEKDERHLVIASRNLVYVR